MRPSQLYSDLLFRCDGCEYLVATLDEVAKSNIARTQNITVARFDCSDETKLCKSKHIKLLIALLNILVTINCRDQY